MAGNEQRDAAMQRALELLSYRPRSRAELRRRLAERDLPPEVVEACLRRLEELGLVDDAELAGMVARDAARFGRSRRRARERMRRLGIEPAVATAVLDAEYPEAREVEVAVAFVHRRFPPAEAAPDARERAVRLLLGRGFGGRARSAAAAVLPAAAGQRAPRRAPDLDELRRHLARRYPGHASDPADRRRAQQFLARRGVRGDDARRLLDGRDTRH